jgi:lipid II isoglutaminyl synthase (glutamine-hydrolysing)
MSGDDRGEEPQRHLTIVQLFPDLLSIYGDSGNLRALVVRAERRGIPVSVDRVVAESNKIPEGDIFLIGGGQDRDQFAVEDALRQLGDGITRRIVDGAALLAVCGGYQNLGRSYRSADGRTVHGPGLFPARTHSGDGRLVGPVVARLGDTLIDARIGGRTTVVGFENHSGRTELDRGARPFARIEIGSGNNGRDGTEGLVLMPDPGSLRGLRIGTYLHGPLLPRNPHVADALLRAGLARTGQPLSLEALDDTEEWRAHDRFVERSRHRSLLDRLPKPVRRFVAPGRNLIGF